VSIAAIPAMGCSLDPLDAGHATRLMIRLKRDVFPMLGKLALSAILSGEMYFCPGVCHCQTTGKVSKPRTRDGLFGSYIWIIIPHSDS